jgi:hypothetical protein
MKLLNYISLLLILILCRCHDEEVTKKEAKLDYYIESFDTDELGLKPELKISYAYDGSGRLSKYTVLHYDADTKFFEEQRYFVFSYSSKGVENIEGFLSGADERYILYAYQYLPNGAVLKITEQNSATGINSEANFCLHRK